MFKHLKTEDYPQLKDFFDSYGWSLCEYSLSSILTWNHCIYDVHYRVEGGLLFISEIETEKPGNRRLLLPLARPFRRPPPAELAGWAARLGYRQYYYAAEDYLAAAGLPEVEKFFTVKEQPGYMDYIYNTSDLAGLKGHKYSRKRNLLAQFDRAVKDAHELKVEPITPASSGRCIALLDEWARDPEIGEQLEMKIYFSSGSSLLTIEAVVKIAWVDVEIKEDGYYRFGVRFVNISPVDMERLTGFLTLYADPNQAPVELKSPAGGRLNPRKPSAPERPGRPPAPNPPPLTPFKRLLSLGRWATGKGKS